jgi:signal transduction histidine kinase
MIGRAHLGHLLQPFPPEELRAQFRRVLGIAYGGLWVLTLILFGVVFCTSFLAATSHSVIALVALLHGLNLLFFFTSRYAGRLPLQITVHVVASVLLMTALIHYVGSTEVGIMVVVYISVMLNAQMVLTTRGYFALANLAAASYGTLVFAEQVGLLPQYRLLFGPGSASWSAVMAVGNWGSLNTVAFYSTSIASLLERKSIDLARARDELEEYSRSLEDKVAARTEELAQVNEALADKARALETRQEELKTFVYGVTHDLKNPLGAIRTTAQILLERDDEPAVVIDDELANINRLAGEMEAMIRDLLQLFSITSTPEAPGSVDLRILVDRIMKTLQPQIDAKGVRVRVDGLPRVWGQGEKLGHVVANLLSNAIKYVRPGEGRVEVGSERRNGVARFWVRDNGIGIPEAYQTAIFELFQRVPCGEQQVAGESVAGTGVGLAIVKRLVDAHRGQVWVESRPGVGSRLVVELPGHGDERFGRSARAA